MAYGVYNGVILLLMPSVIFRFTCYDGVLNCRTSALNARDPRQVTKGGAPRLLGTEICSPPCETAILKSNFVRRASSSGAVDQNREGHGQTKSYYQVVTTLPGQWGYLAAERLIGGVFEQ